MKRLILMAFLAPVASLSASEDRTPTPKEAVLQAVELAGGKGFFRSSLEVAVSEEDGKTVVLFRRPTSDIMVSAGRKPTRPLWKFTFHGREVKAELIDSEAAKPKFDQRYSRKRDQEAARAVTIALSHLWKGREFEAKEFAVDLSEDETRDIVVISHIPYTPDAHTMISVYLDGRVEVSR